jgi:hypothetical protein
MPIDIHGRYCGMFDHLILSFMFCNNARPSGTKQSSSPDRAEAQLHRVGKRRRGHAGLRKFQYITSRVSYLPIHFFLHDHLLTLINLPSHNTLHHASPKV